MPSIENIDHQIETLEQKLTQLKKKKTKELARFRYLQKKKQIAANQTWGMALEQKLKNENDQNKRKEIHAYLKSAMNEMTPKNKKGEKNKTDAKEYLDHLMTEVSETESTENQEAMDLESQQRGMHE